MNPYDQQIQLEQEIARINALVEKIAEEIR